MGLRTRLKDLLSSPLSSLLDDAIRDVVEEVVDIRPLVRRSELDALSARLSHVQRAVTREDADLDGVRQALDAQLATLDDELEGVFGPRADRDTIEEARRRRDALQARLTRLEGATAELASRVTALRSPADQRAD